MTRMEQASKATSFIATNVTSNGIKKSGLRAGDYIRSNKSMTALIEVISGEVITVTTAKGTRMDISANNAIDLIC